MGGAFEDEVPRAHEDADPRQLKGQMVPDFMGGNLTEVKAKGHIHDVSKGECVECGLGPVWEKEEGQGDAR